MPASKKQAAGGGLVAIVGSVTAALLLTNVPAEESGRKVAVEITPDGAATVRHISGKQYLRAYLDMVGVPTACDGLTSYHGRKIKIGDQFTEQQCATMLEEELVVHARGVMQCTPGLALTIPGRDRARFAAVSLAYNVGVPRYCTSTARRLFNEGRIGPACDAILMWKKAGGKIVPGLVARRGRERAVCVKDA
ncbi:lysozyme [Sphingobium sp. CFD-2]|uniref:lysozyme n=1 Tax=Sphingobium sp. CFD-2 TaxID=2878542 RepID=UPI00214C7D5A|nr:lysozyme [Sphingobium sp. CFD-2]